MDLAVEPASTQEGAVKDIGPVGGSEDDDSGIGREAVHFCKQLVEGTFALIVGTAHHAAAAGATNGIDLIDKDDAGSFLFCSAEKVANS